MKNTLKREVVYLVSTFVLTALFVVFTSFCGTEISFFGFLFLAITYQIPCLCAYLFAGGKKWFKRQLKWHKKDQRLVIVIIIFAFIYYLLEILFGNVEIQPSKLLFGFVQAILFGCASEIGWRRFFQSNLIKKLGKKESVFIYFFLALVYTLWMVLISNIGWHIQLPNIIVLFIFMCGHSFCLGLLTSASKSAWPCIIYHILLQWISYGLVLQFNWIATLLIAGIQILCVLLIMRTTQKQD